MDQVTTDRFYVAYDELENTYIVYEDGAGYELGAYYDLPVAECHEKGFAVKFAAYLNEDYNNRKQE